MPFIKMIVGLGNPGNQYEHTRHNAGFDFVDELARKHNGSFALDTKYSALLCKIQIGICPVWLLKPQTFMNLSGKSVSTLANFYKIEPEEILVAHDELDLDPGIAKIKFSGGHGGHNGLRDIIKCLGNSKDFHRLRLGIGHPGNAKEVANYVLKKAAPADFELIEDAINKAIKLDEYIARAQWQEAMNILHQK
ncbi:aminoacyl-tRNA hydrolase [Marinicellulosiphila megalodicopiae]|uniref:aminoacyl-tRNA hydrolase n=1 Tax=Marinicellulosiphila megalodicopiae TaxID=2724896 RepID=UPI003BB0EB1B